MDWFLPREESMDRGGARKMKALDYRNGQKSAEGSVASMFLLLFKN